MKRPTFVAALLAAVLVVPAAALAHGGHAHKVMGTVSSISGNHVVVKTTDGKTVTVMLDAKTRITRGKEVLTLDALKVGDRLVAEGPENKEIVTAKSIQVGAAAKPSAAAKTAGDHAAH